jgi:two-component system OmpR family sensor kinase
MIRALRWLAPGSMAGRLALLLAAGLVGMWLLAAFTAAVVVRRELNEVFDSVLQETAQRLLANVLRNDGARLAALGPQDAPILEPAVPHEEYITYRVFSAAGQLLLRSHGASAEAPVPPPAPGFAARGRRHSYTEPSVDGRYLLTIEEPDDHRGHAIRATLGELLAPLAGLVLAALLLIPRVVRRGFVPMSRLKAEIRRRGGSNLAPIGDLALPAELRPMRDDMNLLLRRLRQALEAERRFTANAAHELRTPLAGALGQGQLLLARLPPGDPARAQAEAMIDGLRRLTRRVEKLLQMARAEAGVALRLEPIDLLVPLHLVVEEVAGRPGVGDRLRLDDGGLDHMIVMGDLDALAIVLRNLIENAVLHGAPDQPIDVGVTAEGRVRVTNGGPAVPPDHLATLAQRFVSHDAGGSGSGTGLGLSIVQAIVEQVGGRLSLQSPASGRDDGFQATLWLPLAADATNRRGQGGPSP